MLEGSNCALVNLHRISTSSEPIRKKNWFKMMSADTEMQYAKGLLLKYN